MEYTCCCPFFFYFVLVLFYTLIVMLEIKIKIKAFNPFTQKSRYVEFGCVFLFYFSLFLCFNAGLPFSFQVLSNANYSIKRCEEKFTQVDSQCSGIEIVCYLFPVKVLKYLRLRCNVKPSRGPFHFRAPSKMFYKAVRGKPQPQQTPPPPIHTHKIY